MTLIECWSCEKKKERKHFFKSVLGKKSGGARRLLCKICGDMYTKQSQKRSRIEALMAYGGKCACCSEAGYPFLSIDHVLPIRRKIRDGKTSGPALYRKLRKEGYPSGYQVLCHNCNMAKRLGERCPHQEPEGVRTVEQESAALPPVKHKAYMARWGRS